MDIQIKTIPPVSVVFRRDRLTIPKVPAHAASAIDSVLGALHQAGVQPAGPVIFVYYGIESDPTQEFDLDICVPAPAEAAIALPNSIGRKTLHAFECFAGEYVGSMLGIAHAWGEVAKTWRESKRKGSGESREVYRQWINFESPENVTELQKGILPAS